MAVMLAVIIKSEEEEVGTTKVRYFIFIPFNSNRKLRKSTICVCEISVILKTNESPLA